MRTISFRLLGVLLLCGAFALPAFAADLSTRVPEAFQTAFGRKPTATETSYWTGRVKSGDKKTYDALLGAMYYQKANTTPVANPATGKSSVVPDDKTSLIKVVLPLFISTYGNNPTDAEKVWWRKRISCGEIKTYKSLVSSMNFHKGKNVRKGSDTICGATAAAAASGSSAGVAKKSLAGVSTHAAGDEVRIGIWRTNGSAIELTANSKFQIREGKSKVRATLGKDDVVKVSYSDGKYHVRGSGISFDTKDIIRIVPLDLGIVQIKNYSDPSVTYKGKNYNRFRGVIEIRKCDGCNELWAINELRVEYYLRGLGETSGTGPEEYIKALGIAARTYVLYHKVVTGGRNAQKGYDITNTADDQIYRGYEYEIITERMSAIFNKVKGVVVTDKEADNLVSTIYFSDSDGRTRSAKEGFGAKTGYEWLQKSVKDPYHVSSTCRGHCVGMSAQGAFGFASKENWNYSKILNYYYNAIKIVKAY